MSDPYAADRIRNAFLDRVMAGHAEAAWVLAEIKMMVLTKEGRTPYETDERLKRAARRLRAAANHIDGARERRR